MRTRPLPLALACTLVVSPGCVVSSYRPDPMVQGATVRLHPRDATVIFRVTGTLVAVTADSVVITPAGSSRRQACSRSGLAALDVWTRGRASATAVLAAGATYGLGAAGYEWRPVDLEHLGIGASSLPGERPGGGASRTAGAGAP